MRSGSVFQIQKPNKYEENRADVLLLFWLRIAYRYGGRRHLPIDRHVLIDKCTATLKPYKAMLV